MCRCQEKRERWERQKRKERENRRFFFGLVRFELYLIEDLLLLEWEIKSDIYIENVNEREVLRVCFECWWEREQVEVRLSKRRVLELKMKVLGKRKEKGQRAKAKVSHKKGCETIWRENKRNLTGKILSWADLRICLKLDSVCWRKRFDMIWKRDH